MKKLLGLALLMVMDCFIATSCSDDADRRRAYVETTHKTPLCYICKVDRNTPNCTPISPQFSHHLK